jgi:hypothetical protein
MVKADHLYAADMKWWNCHIADINCGFTGKRWSCDPPGNTNWNNQDPLDWHVNVLDCRIAEKGLSRDPSVVHSGGNSGYQAINLALHLGATRIILLGFDMCWHGGLAHFFGDHPEELNNIKPDKYIVAFRSIKPEQYGIEILNCSRVTALDAFDRHNLEDVFCPE